MRSLTHARDGKTLALRGLVRTAAFKCAALMTHREEKGVGPFTNDVALYCQIAQGARLIFIILNRDGLAAVAGLPAQHGNDTYYYPNDGIHLFQLQWSHALPDPQLKVQPQARLAQNNTGGGESSSAATPLAFPSFTPFGARRKNWPSKVNAHGEASAIPPTWICV